MPRKNSKARPTTARRPNAKHVPEPQADTNTEPTATTADDRVRQALRANPGTTAAEIAVAAGVGRSTATKALARLASEGSAVRKPGSTPRAADRWHAADEPAATDSKPPVRSAVVDESAAARKAANPPGPRPAATATIVAKKPSRLRPGELHGMVEDFLRERPDLEFTPGDIGRKLNRSSGAVANALVKLTEKGVAALVCDRPKKYQAASDAGD